MGYTPVFQGIFDGTLGGQWPDSGIWLCLLALADWRGHIDMTTAAISGRIGAPVEQVRECIGRFCAPDPESRSQEEEGRRLVPIDPARSWGWRVVNFESYRKRARDAADVAQGRAAERARRYRERHAPSRAVTSSHAESRAVTSAHATQTHTPDSEKNTTASATPTRNEVPRGTSPMQPMRRASQPVQGQGEDKTGELLHEMPRGVYAPNKTEAFRAAGTGQTEGEHQGVQSRATEARYFEAEGMQEMRSAGSPEASRGLQQSQTGGMALPPMPSRAPRRRVDADPEWFLDFKLAYPLRAGDQGWRKAQKAANARISEGHTVDELLAGARRYAEFCAATGKTGTEYVKQACTFLGPDKAFLLPWEIPQAAGNRPAGRLVV